jgi:predicted dehydrogenase
LIEDPDVDVVYIGTIADSHAELATLALQNKKATVVEKPATASYQDTKALVDLAKANQTFFL